ncbi:basic proline-rich protein-like [Camelus ferus]|uniref:Basic proline-rich protein-like n=1 Tax=Camelus ferus TaxID=419612 RepID=A0A8B8UGY4_CAMFR|nr:basic proline-rich protein-like [Camelus ferus]
MGPKTPIRSLGEASSFTVQMRSFQGHVCTGPAGVRVRECVRVRVAGGGSLRSAPRPGPRITPRPAPGGLPGPPPRRAEEGREPGGGAGGRVVPGCHFLPPPRSLRGARPPPPSPAPCGPRREPIIPARPAVAARSPGPASARRRVAGVRERAPSRVLPAAVPPARLPSSPPASGPASRAASSGAHYRVAGGVGPARLRALVPRRRVPASARCSPPAAALAPAPALRSRPGRQRRLGGPGAPRRERPGRAAGPSALGPTSRPLLPRWGSPHPAGRRTRTRGAPTPRWPRAPRLGRAPGHSAGGLRQPSPPRGAPLPGTASALGPRIQHWPQGQRPLLSPGRCQVPPPWQPAEPPAAFALQFSGPPPEPTALCLPQHWGWGQQRRPIRAATPTPPATPARCRRRVDASPLSRAKVGAPGPS